MLRVYHEDEKAEDDWNVIVARQGDPRPVATEPVTVLGQLRNEYLLAVVRPGCHYSVPTRVERPRADGVPEMVEEHCYFELLRTQHSRSREHIMPTVHSADNLAQTAPLAWEVTPAGEARPIAT